MAGRSLTRVQGGVTDTIHINTDKFAGVRTMTTGELDYNEITVSNAASDVNGTWVLIGTTNNKPRWEHSTNSQTYIWNLSFSNKWYVQDNDDDPKMVQSDDNVYDYPWEVPSWVAFGTGTNYPNIAFSNYFETITVNRTAPVIDSDRAGASRPLLSKLVGGAAAAYSLRDLNDKAGNNKVVRVRRESDNDERDFLAKEVSNGTLQNWVNAQTTLPLDLQTLTDDGRTGSVVGAKAAYSLRSLGATHQIPKKYPDSFTVAGAGTSAVNGVYVRNGNGNEDKNLPSYTLFDTDGTTALYSIIGGVGAEVFLQVGAPTSNNDVQYEADMVGANHDEYPTAFVDTDEGTAPVPTLTANQSDKYVVQVRRSSDNATEQFTADEVTDGTLVSFVNEDLGITLGTAESVSAGSVTNASSTGFTYTDDTTAIGGARIPFSQTIPAGATISVTLTTTKSSGMTPSFRLSSGSAFGVAGDPATSSSSLDGTQTFTVKATSDATSFSFFDNVVGTFTISDFKINYIHYEGFVNTWYDQSGNNNHAVQTDTTRQASIVTNGEFNTSGGLEFDGTDKYLLTNSISFSSKALSLFALQDLQGSSNHYTFGNTTLNRGIAFKRNATRYYFSTNAIDMNAANEIELPLRLNTVIHNGTTTAPNVKAFRNGSEIGSNPDSHQGEGNTSTVANQIGAQRSADFLVGTVKEIILYDTDQTDNRTVIEANIANHYGISEVPQPNNDVNGFVEKWYDQSGNDRDATQSTATYQPKIVHQGSFVTEGGLLFDGDDTFFDAGSTLTLGTEFFVTGVINVNLVGDSNGTIIGNDSVGGGNRAFVNTNTPRLLSLRDSNTNIDSNLELSLTADSLFTYQASASSFTMSVNGVTDVKSALSGGMSYRYMGGGSQFNLAANLIELIIYSSDQTLNRPAIEANIANQYGITLS